jgi:PBSX family phage terminase large subunit
MLTAVEQQLATLLQYDPPYEWRGGNKALIDSREPEVIAEGPSETGKTMAACYKMHYNCREYPGSQHTLIRKVAATIPGTVLVTMKRIIGTFPVNFYGGDINPEMLIYPNGSTIWLAGMDKPGKALSGERDTIQVCQAEELNRDDWETLTTRVTGRGSVMPYTQIFGDCNPGGSMHHLKQRAKIGHLQMIRTVHTDNPSLYYADGTLTEQGVRSMTALDKLTGIRRKRLMEGIWATAEGAVFDTFDSNVHVKTQDIKNYKTFRLAMDEGYTHPAVILVIGVDYDGRRHIFAEFYERGKLQSEVVAKALDFSIGYHTKDVAVDAAAAGLIADLRDVGLNAQGGKGRVRDRINAIQDDLKVQGDGRPRLTIDPSCVNTINDFESYVYKPEKDEPKKENDHAPDALGYDYDVDGRTSTMTAYKYA